MRFTNFVTALALLSPGLALAQAAKPAEPVALEIVGTGEIVAPATKLSMTISFTEEGKTQDAADKARAAKLARVMQALKAQGLTGAALSDLSTAEQTKVMLSSLKGTGDEDESMESDDAEADAKAAAKDPSFSATEAKKLTVGSAAQAAAVKAALEKLDVTVGEEEAELDDAGFVAAQHQAKAKALRAARADADVYAKEMGMHVVRIVRISEVGNNLLLPGFQAKFEEAMAKGPKAMAAMFQNPDGAIRVNAAVVVQFELAQ